jgi:hypothetical protein
VGRILGYFRKRDPLFSITSWLGLLKKEASEFPPFPAAFAPNPHEYWLKRKSPVLPGTSKLASLHFGATLVLHRRPLHTLFPPAQFTEENDAVGTTDTADKDYFGRSRPPRKVSL